MNEGEPAELNAATIYRHTERLCMREMYVLARHSLINDRSQ